MGGVTGALVGGNPSILLGSGGGATGELVGGDTWVPLWERGRGYRGTIGRQHMGAAGGMA